MEIYADNFRGFKKQKISIDDVTFFVGENSTGKSSILSALTILQSLENDKEPNFQNGFSDLHFFSDATDNDKNFKLGFSQTENNGFKLFLYEFTSHKGKPILFSVCFYYDGFIVYANKQGYGKKPALVIKKEDSEISFDTINNDLEIFRSRYIDQSNLNEKEANIKIKSAGFLPMLMGTKFDFAETLRRDEHEFNEFAFRRNLPYMVWLAPIRAEAKRIYEDIETQFSPAGEHTPGMIKTLTDTKTKKNKIIDLVNKFGRDSDLFQEIEIKRYGVESDSPFQIMIKIDNKKVRITNTGYGVSQVLPIILEVLSRKEKTFFILMQPEVHLHPKAQAALGELIANLNDQENKKFIIETHSDYLINRYRITKRKNDFTNKSSVSFFYRNKDKNLNQKIEIDEKGKYSKDQPKEFRNFFIQEELRLLEI